MNRDFLRSLGLEDEAINSIMSRHGSTIAAKEDDITTLNKKIKELEDEANNVDVDEEATKQIVNLEKERDELKADLANQSKQHKLETYVNSLGTKDPAYVMDKLSDVEMEDGEFVGIDEKAEELKEAHPLLFEVDEPENPAEPAKPKPWSQGNHTVDDEATKKKVATDLNAHRIVNK